MDLSLVDNLPWALPEDTHGEVPELRGLRTRDSHYPGTAGARAARTLQRGVRVMELRMSTCHPDRLDRARGMCNPCYMKDYRAKNLDALHIKARNRHFKAKYGLSTTMRDALLAKQGFKCALCYESLTLRGARTHVDHDHESGRVRGILCNRCNWYMAKVDADPSIIQRIINHKGV